MMKVILYMATTANGMIAHENDDVEFVSPTEWQSYQNIAIKIGNVIMGHRTFDLMKAAGDLDGLRDIHITVVGRQPEGMETDPTVSFAASPEAALAQVEQNGFNSTLIAGGARLNASLLKENLIDEIYLDIEPTLLGQGIPLANGADFDIRLNLLGTKQISQNEIQLHYQVVKQ